MLLDLEELYWRLNYCFIEQNFVSMPSHAQIWILWYFCMNLVRLISSGAIERGIFLFFLNKVARLIPRDMNWCSMIETFRNMQFFHIFDVYRLLSHIKSTSVEHKSVSPCSSIQIKINIRLLVARHWKEKKEIRVK